MAALLVGMSVMAILMTAALPVWSHMAKREKEAELIWRGQQYARSVGLFQRKYANTYPPTLDVLVEQKFLRKKYKDPITQGDFQLIPAGGAAQRPGGPGQQTPGQMSPTGMGGTTTLGQTGQQSQQSQQTQQGQSGFGQVAPPNIGIAGVVSKSKDTSIKIYNGRSKYNEWAFVYMQTTQGVSAPGGRGAPGRGGPNTTLRPGGGGPMDPGGRGGRPPIPGQFGQPPFGQPPPGQPPFGRPPFGNPGQGQPGPFAPQPGGQRPPVRPSGI